MNNLHVKTGDNVMIISGKDKGKTGKVLQTSPKEGKVIVKKVNIVTKHVKPRKMGEQGGLVPDVVVAPAADSDVDAQLEAAIAALR